MQPTIKMPISAPLFSVRKGLSGLSLLLLICLSLVSRDLFARQIILAFDNTLAPNTSLDGMARSQMLIRNMQRGDVPQAAFLIRTDDIKRSTQDRVMFYDDKNQLLVNKGDKYQFLSKQHIYSYEADILNANNLLQAYLNYHQHVYFPRITQAGDPLIQTKLNNFLLDFGFQPFYVTTQVNDDYLDLLFEARALQAKPVNMAALQKVYVKLVMEAVLNYDARAWTLLGFSPRQVLVLHETDLTAYTILDLIDALNAKGFQIIAPEKVFSDPILNPYFYDGFSATGYMRYQTLMPDPLLQTPLMPTAEETQKIHTYLREAQLDYLIP